MESVTLSSHLSNYDFVFGTIIIVSTIFAIIRGGVAELLSLSTWFLALFAMRRYASTLEQLIPNLITNSFLRSILSYIIAFAAVAILISLIKMMFHKFIHSFGLGGLNYAIGAVFGIARGLIISALVILLLETFNIDPSHTWQRSWLSPVLIPTVSTIVNAIPQRMRHLNEELGKQTQQLLTHDL
jgi:membrane protein required for colicin V production